MIYFAFFTILLPVVGANATILPIVPALLIWWVFGALAGVLASVLIPLVNALMVSLLLPPQAPLVTYTGAVLHALVLISLGILVGRWKETGEWIKSQLGEHERAETALRESEKQYRTLFNNAGDAILICSLDGRFIDANEIACQRLGYSRADLLSMNYEEIESPENSASLIDRRAELQQKGQLLYETTCLRSDGTSLPVELNVRLIEYNQQVVFLSVARDISERKAIERAEREQRVMAEALRNITADLTSTLQLEEVLDRILENLQRVVSHDAAAILLFDNGLVRVARQRGFTEHGLIWPETGAGFPIQDLPALDWMVKTRRPLVISNTQSSKLWPGLNQAVWVQSFAGVPIVLHGIPIGFLTAASETEGFFTRSHTGRLMVFSYPSAVAIQNARLYAEVQRLAMMDELTKCYNRRGLISLGEPEIRRAIGGKQPVAALLIDVDNFKSFNDTYNYSVGDEVLQIMAFRLRENIRKSDLLCRYGGDEFLVLLVDNESLNITLTAERLRKAVESTAFMTSQGPMIVTISIGVSLLSEEHNDLADLIESAGEALHSAKSAGRNKTISLL